MIWRVFTSSFEGKGNIWQPHGKLLLTSVRRLGHPTLPLIIYIATIHQLQYSSTYYKHLPNRWLLRSRLIIATLVFFF